MIQKEQTKNSAEPRVAAPHGDLDDYIFSSEIEKIVSER